MGGGQTENATPRSLAFPSLGQARGKVRVRDEEPNLRPASITVRSQYLVPFSGPGWCWVTGRKFRELESLIGTRPWTGHFGMTALLPAQADGRDTMYPKCPGDCGENVMRAGGRVGYHGRVTGKASNQVLLHFLELRGDKSGTGLGRPSFLAWRVGPLLIGRTACFCAPVPSAHPGMGLER